MEDNKKGFNTLYLVLGVSTLVVAIIGATFAFFSASQTDDTIEGNIAEAGGLVLDVEAITYDPNDETYATGTGNAIIPLNLITNQTPILGGEDGQTVTGYKDATSQFAQAMAGKCRDSLGNNICEVYKITVTNQSATATVQIRGRLSLTSNATNMYWKRIDATTTTAEYTPEDTNLEDDVTPTTSTFTVLESATEIAGMPAVQQGAADTDNYLTVKITNNGSEEAPEYTSAGENVTLYGTDSEAGDSSVTYYVVVWLEELGREQQDEDASTEQLARSYSGTVTFDAVDASGNRSGVTATFLS